MNLIKPQKLQKGDTVVAITLSCGGPGAIPYRYEVGKKQCQETFGVKVIETPNALKSEEWIYEHPEARLDDLVWAFSNPEVKGVFSVIGGDDSIRMLQFLTDEHLEIIRSNPKVFLGYSDTTVSHFICLAAGLSSFYGPAIMAGFAENCGMHDYTRDAVVQTLFRSDPVGPLPQSEGWTLDYLEWKTPENQKRKRQMQPAMSWQYLQGSGVLEGHLLGGCAEVLEVIKGTSLWPTLDKWEGAILFLETSESNPDPLDVAWWLRNYGAVGILESINGILFGRPGGQVSLDDDDYDKKVAVHIERFRDYDDVLMKVAREYGREDLPIVTRMDFGHTDPMTVLPYGANARIDCDRQTVSILDAGVI